MPCISIVVKILTYRGIANRAFLEIMCFSNHNPTRTALPSGLCRRRVKDRHCTNEYVSARHSQDSILLCGNVLRGLMKAHMPNLVQSFPVIMEDTPERN